MAEKNTLLKDLNTELTEKSTYLKEKLTNKINTNINTNSNKKSYAEVTSNIKKINKKIPKIKVTKIHEDKSDMYYNVAQFLVTENSIQAKKIHTNNKKELILSCMTEESVKTAETILSKSLSQIYKIETEKLTNPKLKIVGIDTRLGLNIQTI